MERINDVEVLTEEEGKIFFFNDVITCKDLDETEFLNSINYLILNPKNFMEININENFYNNCLKILEKFMNEKKFNIIED